MLFRSAAGPAGGRARLPPPEPVPDLTKKSRGRRVPTAEQVVSEGLTQKVRFLALVDVGLREADCGARVFPADVHVPGARVLAVLRPRGASEAAHPLPAHQREA